MTPDWKSMTVVAGASAAVAVAPRFFTAVSWRLEKTAIPLATTVPDP